MIISLFYTTHVQVQYILSLKFNGFLFCIANNNNNVNETRLVDRSSSCTLNISREDNTEGLIALTNISFSWSPDVGHIKYYTCASDFKKKTPPKFHCAK